MKWKKDRLVRFMEKSLIKEHVSSIDGDSMSRNIILKIIENSERNPSPISNHYYCLKKSGNPNPCALAVSPGHKALECGFHLMFSVIFKVGKDSVINNYKI